MIDSSLSFARRMLTSFSVDEILLSRYVILSINFRGLALQVKMTPSHLKHTFSVLFAFTWRLMPLADCSRICIRDSAWAAVFVRSARSSTSSSYSVNCLMFSWLLIIFWLFISDFRGVGMQILEMFFPLLNSFFLAGSF